MKIVLTGPESVGKSTLTKQLAKIYNGTHINEFAREYVENLKVPCQFEDVVKITERQLKEYDSIEKQDGFCFLDTYLIISKIWFMHVYNRLPDWFEEEFEKRPVDLYLLCKDDISWQADGVRENEEIRSMLFERYKQELDHYGFNYCVIEGSGEQRVKNAVDAIEAKLKE